MAVNKIKKVLIIFEEGRFTKEQLLDDLKSEGFKYDFKLATDIEEEHYMEYISVSDEVWTFGDVAEYVITVLCKHEGCDIWRMQ